MKTRKLSVGAAAKRTARSRSTADSATKTLAIPSILLEGDDPQPSPPGEHSTPEATPKLTHTVPEHRALPEAYGTARLLFLPRAPRSLYVHCDLTSAQFQHYNKLSADGYLLLRIHQQHPTRLEAMDERILPESRRQFVSVPAAGASYLVELGYYSKTRKWISLAVSASVSTPPEAPSSDKTVHFATMPMGPSRRSSAAAARHTLASAPLAPPRVSWLPGLGESDVPGLSSESGIGFEDTCIWPPIMAVPEVSVPDEESMCACLRMVAPLELRWSSLSLAGPLSETFRA